MTELPHFSKVKRRFNGTRLDEVLDIACFKRNYSRTRPPLGIAALIFAAWLIWNLILPIKIYGFLPFGTMYPWNNLRRNWIKVRFGYQIEAEARKTASLPRYRPPVDVNDLAVFVISLPNNEQRRASVKQQMDAHNIKFTWFDAVDGSKELPLEEVKWYTSGWRLREYLRSSPGSHQYRKAACDLSHLRLMHDMIANNRDVQVILEDDVQFTGKNFLSDLNRTMHNLPEDWDVLWMNHGEPIEESKSNLAGWVGPGLRIFLDNSITVGMVYRRSFALRILNEAQIGNKDIDNLMNDAGQLGMVRAYVADPPLVKVHEAGFKSQIEVFDHNGGRR